VSKDYHKYLLLQSL